MRKKFILLALYLFMMIIGAGLLKELIILITDSNDDFFITALTNFIMYIISVSVGIIIIHSELKVDFINYQKGYSKFPEVVIGYFILLGGNIIGQLLLTLLNYTDPSVNQKGIEILLKTDYGVFVAIAVIIGPIFEELVFRKSLIDILVFKGKFSPVLSIISSSILFGLIHVVFNIENNIYELVKIIPYFFQGLVLGGLYVKKDYNIYLPMFVHILNNTIATLIIILLPAGF